MSNEESEALKAVSTVQPDTAAKSKRLTVSGGEQGVTDVNLFVFSISPKRRMSMKMPLQRSRSMTLEQSPN